MNRSARLFRLALPVFAISLLGACASVSLSPRDGADTAPAADTRVWFAPGQLELGRVLSFDPVGQVVVIELSPFTAAPVDLAGRELLSRDPTTLAPSARLVASKRRTGGMLGAFVASGAPRAGDEVVIAPANVPAN